MKELAYYDGQTGTPEEVMIPFNDRVHFFGDGVYEATLGGNHKIFLLQDHLDRFYSSAKALDIKIPMTKQELGILYNKITNCRQLIITHICTFLYETCPRPCSRLLL